MKKSRAKSAYKTGKPRYKKRRSPGVYIIYREGSPAYIGYSASDVYKSLYRHFQRWNDPKQIRVTYSPIDPQITVRVIYTRTAQQAANLEYALIIKYQPTDNPRQYLPIDYNNQAISTILQHYEDIKTYSGDDPF